MTLLYLAMLSLLTEMLTESITLTRVAKFQSSATVQSKSWHQQSVPGIIDFKYRSIIFFRNNALFIILKTAGAKLTNRGARVNANTQIVQVLWGTGSYDSSVRSTTKPSVATFFQEVITNGALTSWCK